MSETLAYNFIQEEDYVRIFNRQFKMNQKNYYILSSINYRASKSIKCILLSHSATMQAYFRGLLPLWIYYIVCRVYWSYIRIYMPPPTMHTL